MAVEETIAPPGQDSTDSNVRYAAYATRLRTILLASSRYVAYTSDIGESFRPVVPPTLVRACYGISWAYVLGDVGLQSWRAKMRQEGRYKPGLLPWHEFPPVTEESRALAVDAPDWRLVGLERGLFQSIASMGLPAFTIHSSVKIASKMMKNAKNPALRTWGPVGIGLAIVPALPYLFDEPVEHGIEYIFEKGREMYRASEKSHKD